MKWIDTGLTFPEAILIWFFQTICWISIDFLFVRLFSGLLFFGFEKRQLYLFWSVCLLPLPIISFAKSDLSRPGFEPGLLRPQPSVLTTRRSRPKAETKKWFRFGRMFPAEGLITFVQQHGKFFRKSNDTAFCWVTYSWFWDSSGVFLCSVCVLPLPKICLAKSFISRSVFEPGLLRPQGNSLTTTIWAEIRKHEMNRHWTNLSRSNFDLIFLNNMLDFRWLPVRMDFFWFIFHWIWEASVAFVIVCLSASSSINLIC